MQSGAPRYGSQRAVARLTGPVYSGEVYTLRPCSVSACARSALTGLDVCALHCADIPGYEKRITDILKSERKLADYDINGTSISGLTMEGVTFTGCNLQGVRWDGLVFHRATFQLSFFDGSGFRQCDFSGSTAVNCIFAASLFQDCILPDCDLLQCNFLGVRCRDTSFDHSNLYAGRFIRATFANVGMRDCNLKRVRFDAKVTGVDFRASNTEEASYLEESR